MSEISLNGIPVVMEVDTGSDVTIINEDTFKKINGKICS